jgi:hypothetical protein
VVEGHADQSVAVVPEQRRALTSRDGASSVARMLPQWYLEFSASSGPSFIAAWSNADVAIVSLSTFALAYILMAVFTASWLLDVAFLALVVGGILVTWPAMVALTIAAVFVAIVVGLVHKRVAPERQARIDQEAEAVASAAVADFERDLGRH